MSDYQCQVHFAMDDIPAAEWNRLAAHHGLYFTYEWQQNIEYFIGLTGKHPYLFSLRQGERLLALAVGYNPDASSPMYYPPNVLFTEEFLRLSPAPDATEWESIERVVRELDPDRAGCTGPATLQHLYKRFERDLTPCLVLSCAFTSQVIVDPTLSTDEQAVCHDTLLDWIETYAKANGFRSVAFLYGLQEEVAGFKQRGYQSSWLSALAYMDTKGMTSMEDYLMALPGNRRTPVRREIKSFLGKGFQQQYEPLQDAADEIALLEFNLLHKYGKARPLLGILEEKTKLDELFGEDVRVFTLRQDDLMCASAIYIPHSDALYVTSIGFDYELTEGSFSYPNLVFYHPITYAIEHNMSYVDLGIEAFAAKILRGAQLAPRHASFLAFNSAGRELLDAWLPLLHSRQEHYFSSMKPYKMDVAIESIQKAVAAL